MVDHKEEVNKNKMDEIFSNISNEEMVAILIHPSPDPDCLGAAQGFAVLLKEIYGISSKIFHLGEISHPQNRSIKNVLHIQLEDGRDLNPNDFSAVVVLDTDLDGTGLKSEKLKDVDVRIDHHITDRGNGAKLKDVRTVGSTCSIVWDYLRAFDVKLEDYKDEATAMVLGIKTDTLDFTRADTSDLDLEAYRSLLPLVDKNSLAKVINYPLPKSLFEIEAKAFKNRNVRGTTLVSFIGDITPHNRDMIPTIADRFSRIDGVSTAIIMGLIENDITVSVRSDDARVDVHDLCVGAFGKENAGGKDGSGGARFHLGPAFELVEDRDVKEKVKSEVVSQLTEKIFEALGEHEVGEE
jgi:nanoRNase/pAp phosphatase (c-di-AMP/oligoRNAs hydrolase)